ncbi:FeoB-associated Cys-rich membrane protein [Laedolimicola sp.]|uniref:FeoB-associated Cys-rich membrane protein n=1 Tax=Laedolimicola sp. TaxID=2981663 RepID=UPI003F803949
MLADIIVVAIVAIIAVCCIRTLIHNKKTCGTTCSMGCAGCSCGGSCGCGAPAKRKK